VEPFIIGVLPRYAEVRTINPRALIQSIELQKPRYITQGKHVYIASTSHVWQLVPVSIPMQIQQLLQDKQFNLALMLAVSSTSGIFYCIWRGLDILLQLKRSGYSIAIEEVWIFYCIWRGLQEQCTIKFGVLEQLKVHWKGEFGIWSPVAYRAVLAWTLSMIIGILNLLWIVVNL